MLRSIWKKENLKINSKSIITYFLVRWQSLLYSLIQSNQIYPHMSVTTPNIAESRRLLVFVNPNSGPGVALKTFNTRIRSFLGEANISYDLIVTTHVGHCQQIIQDSKDLSKYTGIVAVSGDGLLYEVSLHYIIDHNMIKNKQLICFV
jgi:hypothetical protein